jgi:hypothetical protein
VALQDPELDSPGALVEAVAEHLAATPDPVAAAGVAGSRPTGTTWSRSSLPRASPPSPHPTASPCAPVRCWPPRDAPPRWSARSTRV